MRMPMDAKGVGGAVAGKLASRLRFPQLFVLALVLFILDLLIPDFIPFIDEILLGLITFLLGSWRTAGSPPPPAQAQPPMKDVTPREGSSDG
jgi:predicted MFS family arabinose efflux permease